MDTATESKTGSPGAASQELKSGHVVESSIIHWLWPKNVLQRRIMNVLIKIMEEGKMVNIVLISWSLPHIPWGRPRSQCGVDSAQVQGQPPGQAGPLRSLLGSPSVTSHLLFRGLLVSTTVRVTQGASHRLPTHSGESPPATPMQWEHRPHGGRETLLHRLQIFLCINSPTNSAKR